MEDWKNPSNTHTRWEWMFPPEPPRTIALRLLLCLVSGGCACLFVWAVPSRPFLACMAVGGWLASILLQPPHPFRR